MVHDQAWLANFYMAGRKLLIQSTTDHHLNQAVSRHFVFRGDADERAVAQHHDAIRDGVDLVEAMTDVDDADAVRLQLAYDGEEPLDFRRGQCCARLVHDDDAGVL